MRQISERKAAKLRAVLPGGMLVITIINALAGAVSHGWFVLDLVAIGVFSVLFVASLVMVFRTPRSG